MLNESDAKELGGLERSLRSLRPQAADVNRERIAYEAGRASAQPKRVWPALTFAATALAAVFGVMLWNRPAPQVVREVVIVREQAPKTSVPDESSSGSQSENKDEKSPRTPMRLRSIRRQPAYVHERDVALRLGVDALGSPTHEALPMPPLRPGDLYLRPDRDDPAQPIYPPPNNPWSLQ